MRTDDCIAALAHAEAWRVRPITDSAELDALAEAGRALPVLHLSRGSRPGEYRVSGAGHAGHDNEPRMALLAHALERRVLPLVDPACDVSGAYRVELHDSYAYLPNAQDYENCFTFSRPITARAASVALLPDPFHWGDYGGLLRVRDAVPWEAKADAMFFCGSTTGDRRPAHNARIRACLWAQDRVPATDARFVITNVVQMDVARALAEVPRLAQVLSHPVAVEDHFRWRYLVNIAGNTACWSRVPMILNSRSLLLDLRRLDASSPPPDVMWYSPALRDGTHYVGADSLEDLVSRLHACRAAQAACRDMTRNAGLFVQDFLNREAPAAYTARLLEACAERHRA